MSTIIHFEIPADDVQRARTFYHDLLGWTFDKYEDADMPEGTPEYWLFRTTKTSGEEAVGGAIMPRQQPQQPITNYIDVSSLDETLPNVEQLGGKLLTAKMTVPKMGYFALCQDTENNVFGLWEDDPDAQ